MKRLIKIELLKNLAYRPFKIFSIIYLCLIIILAFVGFAEINLGFIKLQLKSMGIYNFPNVWHFTAYFMSLIKIFLAAIIVYGIAQEFTNRMFKQNIIDGLSKWEFLKSKLLTITIFSFISSLILLILAFLIGLQNSDPYSIKQLFAEVHYVGLYFIEVFLFLTLFLFLTIIFRNAIFPFLMIFILSIVEGIIKATNWIGELDQFLPLSTTSKLVREPFSRINVQAVSQSPNGVPKIASAYDFPWTAFIMAIVYIIALIWGAKRILEKRDW